MRTGVWGSAVLATLSIATAACSRHKPAAPVPRAAEPVRSAGTDAAVELPEALRVKLTSKREYDAGNPATMEPGEWVARRIHDHVRPPKDLYCYTIANT